MIGFRAATDYWVKVSAKFMIDSNGSVDKPSNYYAILYDKNPISKNRIASEFLRRDGKVVFEFPLLASIRKQETPLETKPDLFLKLFKKDELIFTTKVFWNVNFFIHDYHRRQVTHNSVYLGTFRVKIDEARPYEPDA